MLTVKLLSIATSPHDQELGLQFVRSIPKDSGMLFSYKSPRVLSFWMRNCYIPLEIMFADSDGVIVKTERMIPLSTRSVSSGRPCVMALEVPAGTLDEAGEVVGKKLTVGDGVASIA
jgi:hypothetical protein